MEDGDMIDAHIEQVRETVLVMHVCRRFLLARRRRRVMYVDQCNVSRTWGQFVVLRTLDITRV